MRPRGLTAFASLAALALGGACGGGSPAPAPVSGVDLAVNRGALVASLAPGFQGGPDDVVEVTPAIVDFAPDDCALDPDEGLVGGPGLRRLVRFTTLIENLGDLDLAIGNHAAPEAPWTVADFHYSPCHGHVHFTADLVEYRVVTPEGLVVGVSHKQGFCIEDVYDADGNWVRGQPGRYGCAFMGISAGHADAYFRDLPGQWVDVTDVAAGDYVLEVEVNPSRDPRFLEPVDWTANNVARVRIRLP